MFGFQDEVAVTAQSPEESGRKVATKVPSLFTVQFIVWVELMLLNCTSTIESLSFGVRIPLIVMFSPRRILSLTAVMLRVNGSFTV